jgi:hypothetical protein
MSQYETLDRLIIKAVESSRRIDFISLLFDPAGVEAARISEATGRDKAAILQDRICSLRSRKEIWDDGSKLRRRSKQPIK